MNVCQLIIKKLIRGVLITMGGKKQHFCINYVHIINKADILSSVLITFKIHTLNVNSPFKSLQSVVHCSYFLFIVYSGIILEKAMAPPSSTLAWKIPWTEEPGRLQSMVAKSRT